jgi:hypothetical protein
METVELTVDERLNRNLESAVELYHRIALNLRFIALTEPKLIEAKRQVEQLSLKLETLRKQYSDLLIEEQKQNYREGDPDPNYFYGTDPTVIMSFPGLAEKRDLIF